MKNTDKEKLLLVLVITILAIVFPWIELPHLNWYLWGHVDSVGWSWGNPHGIYSYFKFNWYIAVITGKSIGSSIMETMLRTSIGIYSVLITIVLGIFKKLNIFRILMFTGIASVLSMIHFLNGVLGDYAPHLSAHNYTWTFGFGFYIMIVSVILQFYFAIIMREKNSES